MKICPLKICHICKKERCDISIKYRGCLEQVTVIFVTFVNVTFGLVILPIPFHLASSVPVELKVDFIFASNKKNKNENPHLFFCTSILPRKL